MKNARAQAVNVLLAVLHDHKSLQAVLAALPDKDKALIQHLCYGVLRRYDWLKGIIMPLLDKPLRPKDFDIELLLLLGVQQLVNMRIPEHAAVKETADAAKSLRKQWAVPMVNAVLRNVIRRQESLIEQVDSVATQSHPTWLMVALQQAYPEHWQEIVTENNIAPPMHLRVNVQKTDREHYLGVLREHEIDAEASTFSPVGITLPAPQDVSNLPHFQDGWVSVQDVAAQHAALFLDAKPGERILDACAAPGGKTGHILETCPDCHMLALDHDSKRLAKVKENLARLDLSATLVHGDAMKTNWWDHKAFDKILVDAPCSGTGVIRRHPDIKFLRQPEDITKLAEQQLAILNNLWPMLKPKGILLYATCSVLPAENGEVIRQFRKAHHDAKVLETRQILPQERGPDGFYYCRLQKTA